MISSQPEHFDVIVIGAGMVGSAAAWRLASRAKVLMIERFELGHRNGSSHGGSRIFRHAYEDVRYVRMALASGEGWRELERDTGEALLFPTGGLDLGPEGHPDMVAIAAALEASDRPTEQLSGTEIHRRFPAFRAPDGHIALYQPDAGILAADRCVTAMQRLAASRGASIRSKLPVTSIDTHSEGVRVDTADGSFTAARLVLAAGAWTSQLLDLALPLRVKQQQVIYLGVPPGDLYSQQRFPIFIDRESLVYGFPRFEHAAAIKIAHHGDGVEVTPATRSFNVDHAWAEETIERVRRWLPETDTRPLQAETCLYTMTPDEHFLVDLHPDHPELVIAAGFSGHGFKFGPVLGQVLADLALQGSSRHDLSLFAVDRFQRL